MAALPTGTVTFLFTDVEGSTRLWEQHPDQMRAALARHDALIEALVEAHGGCVVRPRGEGDSRFAVFARATDAVAAAAAIQRALHAEPWPPETPLRVRLALHTGEADLRDGDYYGSAVNRCARLRAVAHGGQVLVSEVTAGLVRDTLPPGVLLRDLGKHRLSDLARPEHVHQLTGVGLPAEFRPLRSLDAYPHNLPVQLTTLIGREAEIEALRQRLHEPQTRLVTLTGPAGVGKTRLALQVATGLLDAFPDGLRLVEFGSLLDPARVPQAVAEPLGAREEPGRALPATLAAVLRPKRVLLVLDNCEHLIEACAALAARLLRACPHLRILATSREPLGITGELTWRVPPLGLPDVVPDLPDLDADQPHAVECLARAEAVQLFVERARLAQPGFALTSENAQAVAHICARLDGLPLAIELAAARVRALSPEQIAARLHDRFRLLTGAGRTGTERHQTLRAALDWSHHLLSEQERALFRRLTVFTGGRSLAAAEAVCAGNGIEPREVLDLLTQLVDKSLLYTDGQDGEVRYWMLETIWQYGRERLREAGEADALRARHAAYYAALAEGVGPKLQGPEPARWLDLLKQEQENLRAALAWCQASADVEQRQRLAAVLRTSGLMREHLVEAARGLKGAAAP
jgi:predicted ATPase/class 3 adenylate cyclase